MKDILKRWNQLAGTDKTIEESGAPKIAGHDLYGNQHIQSLLKEEFHPDLDEDIDEDLGDALADKAEEDESKDTPESSGEEAEEDESEIGDEEKPTLSNSDLAKGLKQGAKAIADEIPPTLNDEFADIMNSVKGMASDKQKLVKLMKYIEKIG